MSVSFGPGIFVILFAGLAAGPTSAQIQDLLRNRLEAARVTGQFRADGEPIHAVRALPDFYLARDHRPAWVLQSGEPGPGADALLRALQEADGHGLEGADYHGAALSRLRSRSTSGPLDAGELVDLEILLTDAFLAYGSHLLLGRVDPERVEPEWLANRRGVDMGRALESALASGRIREALDSLAPRQPEYMRLRRALRDLREVQETGGWTAVVPGPTLREGDADPRVFGLRARLQASTDSRDRELAGAGRGDTLDAALADAVRHFQLRHGLEVDGAVGSRTLTALNVPVETRIQQLRANLERWRWLPAELGRRHIRVNIAAFETEVWDDGEVRLTLRSIVGRQYRRTPSFTGTMRYLVLAPYWHVPPTIAAVDKLPEVQRDVTYLHRQRFTVLDAATNDVVDPATVNWSALTGADLNRRYRLRQDPGPGNALGNVKFMFPNAHNVYLHDTPQRELFDRTQRDFSSGCIRVERPLELARFLLSDDPGWTMERFNQVVAEGRERSVTLRDPVPVHLLYMTAYVDEAQRVHFRPDLYGRDVVVLEALAADPPGS